MAARALGVEIIIITTRKTIVCLINTNIYSMTRRFPQQSLLRNRIAYSQWRQQKYQPGNAIN